MLFGPFLRFSRYAVPVSLRVRIYFEVPCTSGNILPVLTQFLYLFCDLYLGV